MGIEFDDVGALAGHSHTESDISDLAHEPANLSAIGTVTITGAAQGDILHRNGTEFVNLAKGTDGQVLRSTSTDVAWEDDVDAIEILIDGGGSAITTGVKGFIEVPYACTITRVTALAEVSGSIVVDIWKCAYADYDISTHPVNGDSITASAPVTISSAVKAQDSTLTGWTKTLAAGDVLAYNVDSCTTITRLTVSLLVKRT